MKLETILYAEDDSDICAVVSMILARQGISVLPFSSGQQAIEAMDQTRQTVDLILLDLMMPGMDGLATLNELRQRKQFETVPCVFLTARCDAQTVRTLKNVPNVSFISKPFNFESLVDDLQKHFNDCHNFKA